MLIFDNNKIWKFYINLIIENRKRNIGIVGFPENNNIGNQLLEYSKNLLLKKFGFNPTLISLKRKKKVNIHFLRRHLKIKEINNFYTDIKINDFDFLKVNSDQPKQGSYLNLNF